MNSTEVRLPASRAASHPSSRSDEWIWLRACTPVVVISGLKDASHDRKTEGFRTSSAFFFGGALFVVVLRGGFFLGSGGAPPPPTQAKLAHPGRPAVGVGVRGGQTSEPSPSTTTSGSTGAFTCSACDRPAPLQQRRRERVQVEGSPFPLLAIAVNHVLLHPARMLRALWGLRARSARAPSPLFLRRSLARSI